MASLDRTRSSPLGYFLVEAAGCRAAAPHLQVADGQGGLTVVTYGESLTAARRIALGLIAAGLAPGQAVALIGESSPLYVQACFGIWLAGGVLCPLDPQWPAEAQGRALTKAEVGFGLSLPGGTDRLAAATAGRAGPESVARFIALDAAAVAAAAGEAEGGGGAELPSVAPEARALVLFTSGTTGEPKAAVLAHSALAWNAGAVGRGYGVTPGDNLLGVLPLHHVFGLLTAVVMPPMSTARVTFPPSLKGPELAATIRDAGVTLVAAVPALVLGIDRAIAARLADRPPAVRGVARLLAGLTRLARQVGINPGPRLFREIHQRAGPRLRLLASAGAALDPAVARRLHGYGFRLVQAYGLTECGPAVSLDRLDRPTFGSVGYPMPGIELVIAAPGPDGVGEIAVRSPSLFDGYLDDPAATAAVLVDGWLRTGDLGRLDHRGRLWITGRSKEVIVLGSGKNVYPHEIEARLDESRFIAESCVVGRREGGVAGSEKLHAVVVPDLAAFRAAGQTRIEATLLSEVIRVGDQLPSHHRVSGVTVRSEPLPRTPLGKLRRFEVEQALCAAAGVVRSAGADAVSGGALAAAAAPASAGWPAVQRALRRAAPAAPPITPLSTIELDLGLDSLGRVEALAALEEELGMRLPEGFGAGGLTAGDLLAAVERHRQGDASGDAFPALTRGGEDELHRWPRRLLRPVGIVVVAVAVPLLAALARRLWGFRVLGREHLPGGAYLVCPNHGSYLDALFVLLALPAGTRLRFWSLGDHAIFSWPPLRVVALAGQIIPVNPDQGLRATLAAGGAVLRSGAPLVLFPEGMRAHAGERATFRRGAAILARALAVPIVPTWLEGVDRILPRGSRWPRLGPRVSVRFGAPIPPGAGDGAADPAAVLTERLRERVVALGEQARGEGAVP